MAEVGSQERDPVQSASSLTVALVTCNLALVEVVFS